MYKIVFKSLTRLHPCNLALVYRYFSKVIGGNRALAHFLSHYVKPCPGDRLLDVGCGPGRLAENLPPGVDYVGIDSNELDISWARKNSQGVSGRDFRCCRLEEIPATEGGFDIILMSGLLHHLNDQEVLGVMKASKALLNANGRIITLDGVRTNDQGWVEKLILDFDRGKHVRDMEGYLCLTKQTFPSATVVKTREFLRIPYTHLIMTATKE